MLPAVLALCVGLLVLIWSADRFVDGAAATARHLGMPPLLIGMLIVGFGTSAPELMVSGFSAAQGNPGIALGNAYGSNITNIALILGVAALISPLDFHSSILRKELPILTAVTALAAFQLADGALSRGDAVVLLGAFAMLLGWSIYEGVTQGPNEFGGDVEKTIAAHPLPLRAAVIRLLGGLVLLIVSSRVLVWGGVEIAIRLGISDLIIGLTVIAVGTSLPELASAIAAARKGEHDIALGNVIGSNLFNTLAAVGLAAAIEPMTVEREVLTRDVLVMSVLTVSLFLIGYRFRRTARINRIEGAALLAAYVGYMSFLAVSAMRAG